jgi:hypothetical protein
MIKCLKLTDLICYIKSNKVMSWDLFINLELCMFAYNIFHDDLSSFLFFPYIQ